MSDIINEIARKLAAGVTESQMTLPTPPANPASEVGERLLSLPDAHRSALLQFSADDELLLAENVEEAALVHEMMQAGLVSYIHAAGHIFMQLRPPGKELRAHLLSPARKEES